MAHANTNAALFLLLVFVIQWAACLASELQVSSIAGCIGLHYFENAPSNGRSRPVQGLVWSLTSSFGTVCYASFVLTLIKIADAIERKVIHEARTSANPGVRIAGEILHCLWRYLRAYLEYLTKMAVIASAITGMEFCTAAKANHKMTVRHNFDGFNVDGFASFVLRMLTLAVALLVGYAAYEYDIQSEGADVLVSVLKSLFMGYTALVICGMVAGILIVIVNTHYFCYVLDLDHSYAPAGRTQHIHELYSSALQGQLNALKKSKKYKKSAQGKREAAQLAATGAPMMK